MTSSPRPPPLEVLLGLRRRRLAGNPDRAPGPGDPKSVVTPDAFAVAPELLGIPLAAPWRRLAALVLDLVLIGCLQLLGWRFVLGGAALMLFLVLVRPSGGARPSPLRRAAAGCGGALVLVVTVLVSLVPTMLKNRVLVPTPDGTGFTIRASPAHDTTGADDPDARDAVGTSVVLGTQESSATTQDSLAIQGSVEALDSVQALDSVETLDSVEALDSVDAPDALGTADTATAGPNSAATGFDTFAAAFMHVADSVAAADTAATDRVNGSRATAFDWIRDAADEAGLVFGWGTVYITLFLALWDGRTPGKRALDLRVVRVTGGPLGLLMSFERAGGYAAGFATGLLGFARAWWDPNRQAIHDKIAETVVIREKLARESGLWGAEARRDIPAADTGRAPAAATKRSNEPKEEETR